MLQYSVRIAEVKYLSFFRKMAGFESRHSFLLTAKSRNLGLCSLCKWTGEGVRGAVVKCPGQNGRWGSTLCSVLYKQDWSKKHALKKLYVFPLETRNPIHSCSFNTGLNIFCSMELLFLNGFLLYAKKEVDLLNLFDNSHISCSAEETQRWGFWCSSWWGKYT